ncbi:hypothetical protein QBC44DRAFT_363806 [Cladorrhinum sp. PSN332]|nr:hypothetical protein QBC44DRAFT_363806 [Cladorrhinum sp. PSN332]
MSQEYQPRTKMERGTIAIVTCIALAFVFGFSMLALKLAREWARIMRRGKQQVILEVELGETSTRVTADDPSQVLTTKSSTNVSSKPSTKASTKISENNREKKPEKKPSSKASSPKAATWDAGTPVQPADSQGGW